MSDLEDRRVDSEIRKLLGDINISTFDMMKMTSVLVTVLISFMIEKDLDYEEFMEWVEEVEGKSGKKQFTHLLCLVKKINSINLGASDYDY